MTDIKNSIHHSHKSSQYNESPASLFSPSNQSAKLANGGSRKTTGTMNPEVSIITKV